MILSEAEVRRVLKWANGCARESYLTEEDWPLIDKLIAAAPASVDPNDALQREIDGR